MTTTTLTLADFLLARIAEDEATVTTGGRMVLSVAYGPGCDSCWGGGSKPHEWTCFRRVFAECEAKRRIVEEFRHTYAKGNNLPIPTSTEREADLALTGQAGGLLIAIACLALVYADHPDYRAEWRP